MTQESPSRGQIAPLLAALDRGLDMPPAQQLRGILDYGILTGALRPGERLPTVRELAAMAGLAPMTVVATYGRMKQDGLIETRGKAGTFVAEGRAGGRAGAETLRGLAEEIDRLLLRAGELGIGGSQLAGMVGLRARLKEARPRLEILLVGMFDTAVGDYLRLIRPLLDPGDGFSGMVLSDLRARPPARRPDIALSPMTRRAEVQALLGDETEVLAMSFLPATETRVRLAALEPGARVVMVSTQPQLVLQMRAEALRFLPHVEILQSLTLDDPQLSAALAEAQVVIHASRADSVRDGLRPDQTAIEYRYTPDLGVLRKDILPRIEALRARRTGGTATGDEGC
ncbi:GntR family transcriptional regulator [Poseidonocella sp. HB161398]|uniref:GntR family transcriptional regulator n=1 Tax=Poseidonocella sp. HB161398 TaxID=2320855 RepID=UPI001108A61A|nr:GntR family transcriptional regulator [Poseidonocella sp. HB161398]